MLLKWILAAVIVWLTGQAVRAEPTASLTTASAPGDELPVVMPEAVGMSSEQLAKVKSALQEHIDDGAAAGAIVAAARRGKVVLLESVGWADLEEKKPLQTDAILRFYSMTKPITSVAAMMLAERGQIGIDDPVKRYIPEFEKLEVFVSEEDGVLLTTELDRAFTVRDLLRHTSGFTYGFFGNTPVDREYRQAGVLQRHDSLDEMVQKLAQLPLLYQPGSTFNYGVSTDVLGLLIERVSGKSLDVFFQQQIFAPLAMRDTHFFVPTQEAHRFVHNYGPGSLGEGLRVVDAAQSSRFLERPLSYSGGGGLVSTARDYLRFCQMLLNRGELNGVRLLEAATVDEMTRNQLPENAYPISLGGPRPGVGFGLGFSVVVEQTSFTRSSRVGEYGWGGAASTHFWISPDDELAVVVLSQRMPFSPLLKETVKPLAYEAVLESE